MDTLSFGERTAHIWYTVLLAVSQGNLAIVQRFLKAGIPLEPCIEDDYNWTDSLLQQAIRENQVEMAGLLLDNGATPNAWQCGNSCKTRVSLEAALGHHALLNLLLQYGGGVEGSQALWDITTRFDVMKSAQTLLELGADINEIFTVFSVIEGTELHAAAGFEDRGLGENTVMTKWLLQHGIDHTIKNGAGQTALQVAEQRGHTQVGSLIESWIQDHTVQ